MAVTNLILTDVVYVQDRRERNEDDINFKIILTSGLFVQSLAAQMPLPSKYFPVSFTGHLIKEQVPDPSNIQLPNVSRYEHQSPCLFVPVGVL